MAQDPRYSEAAIPPPQELGGNPFGDDEDDFSPRPVMYEGYKPDYSDGGTYEDVFGPAATEQRPSYNDQYSTGSIAPQPQQGFAEPDFEADFVEKDLEDVGPGPSISSSTPGTEVKVEQQRTLHVWNIEYYSYLFNVDTTEVGLRMVRSVIPFSVQFFKSVENNPDLYGPFWVATTLIFVIAASGNFADWLHNRDDFHYHFEEVSFAAGAIYGYVSIVPVLLWLAFRWLSVKLSLLQNLCIYGYSLFVFIPVSILCILPFEFVRWIIISAAAVLSTLFLLMNFYPPLLQNKYQESKQKLLAGLIVSAIIAVLHLGLALSFKLYFFNYPE